MTVFFCSDCPRTASIACVRSAMLHACAVLNTHAGDTACSAERVGAVGKWSA
jgi:hypothetical protein